MFYLVYQITNLINNKIYVGVHKTKNIDDGYMGSGILIKKAQAKYGIKNFKKEILAECSTAAEMFEMESLIVNQEFVSSNGTYNLKVGGIGGFDHINDKLSFKERSALGKDTWNNRTDKKSHISKMLAALAEKVSKDGATFKGKSHSLKTKKAIGAKSAVHQKGKGNSQAGTTWIYSIEKKINMKIKIEELGSYEVLGWTKGRKMTF
jgi:hypothetical protein